MKFKHIYVLLSSVLLWIFYNSNSGGAGSTNFNCNNCHSGSNTTTTIDSIVLRDVTTLDKLVKYSPGKPYVITIYGSNSGALNRFGFQANHGGKGAFSNPSADCQTSGSIWEHKQKISGNAGKFQVSARWNAPVKGSGTVKLEAYLNAVDNDNNTTGDKPSSKFTYSFEELTSSDSAAVEIRIIAGSRISKLPEPITYKAFPYNGGTTPEYQWKVNGKNIGTRGFEDTYTSSTLKNNDSVTCWMYSSNPGALPNPAISNTEIRTILGSNPVSIQSISDPSGLDLVPLMDKKFKIVSTFPRWEASIFTLNGKLALTAVGNPQELLDLSSLVEGMYIVKIQIHEEIYTKKVLLK